MIVRANLDLKIVKSLAKEIDIPELFECDYKLVSCFPAHSGYQETEELWFVSILVMFLFSTVFKLIIYLFLTATCTLNSKYVYLICVFFFTFFFTTIILKSLSSPFQK